FNGTLYDADFPVNPATGVKYTATNPPPLGTPIPLTRRNNFGLPNNDGSQPDGTNARRYQIAVRLRFYPTAEDSLDRNDAWAHGQTLRPGDFVVEMISVRESSGLLQFFNQFLKLLVTCARFLQRSLKCRITLQTAQERIARQIGIAKEPLRYGS